jgi:hypothetical protein
VTAAVSQDDRPVWVIYPTEDQPPQLVRSHIEVTPVVAHGRPVRVTNIRPTVAHRLAKFRTKTGVAEANDFHDDRKGE